MADDPHSVRPPRRVVVVLHPRCLINRAAIEALLRAAGVTEVVFVTPEEACAIADPDGITIVVPVDEEVGALPDTEEACRHCANGGGAVVVVLGPEWTAPGLHPLARDYGTQCGWRPEDLRRCLIEDEAGMEPPRNPAGDQTSWQNAKPVKCGSR